VGLGHGEGLGQGGRGRGGVGQLAVVPAHGQPHRGAHRFRPAGGGVAAGVQGGELVQQRGVVTAVGGARGHHGRIRAALGQGGGGTTAQGGASAQLQHCRAVVHRLGEGVGEADGGAQLPRPVGGVQRRAVDDGGLGGGVEDDVAAAGGDAVQGGGQARGERCHAGGVGGHVVGHPAGEHALGV